MKELINFRTLKVDEVECRVATSNGKGASLLIYKTARVDYAILDETVGMMNWKVDYKEVKGNMYCGISIYDENKNEWITKWNCGTEAKTEAEKSEASDAIKRSGFAWGIGRELYTSPFIWVNLNDDEIKDNKIKPSVKFSVKTIDYDKDRNINKLVIIDSKGNERFTFGTGKAPSKPKETKVKEEPKTTTQPNVDVDLDFMVDPMPYIEPTPVAGVLTRYELDIIARDPALTAVMKDCLGGVKYNTLSDEGKTLIAKQLRNKMKEMGI